MRTVVREDGLGNGANTEYRVGFMVELRFDSAANNFKLLRIQNAGDAQGEQGLHDLPRKQKLIPALALP